MYESAQKLRREGFFLADSQKPAGYIAIIFAAAAGAIAGCVTAARSNTRVTAGLHQWGDIWLAYQPGPQLTLTTTSNALFTGLLAGWMACSFVWFVFLLFKPDQSVRQIFNFFAGALLTGLIFVLIIFIPGRNTLVIMDRTHGWITGGSIPAGDALNFSRIRNIGTYNSPSSRGLPKTTIGALTANGPVDLLTISSNAQAQNIASRMQAFMGGQNDGVTP
jgi:hypothetical protein